MLQWLKNLLNRKKKPRPYIPPEGVMSDDPIMRQIVSECWNSGNAIVGRLEGDEVTLEYEDGSKKVVKIDDEDSDAEPDGNV